MEVMEWGGEKKGNTELGKEDFENRGASPGKING